MARSHPPDFVNRLVEAATAAFASRGYAGTRMADVAEVLDVAPGTLYTYVESKRALFYLVVDRGARSEPIPLPDTLPLPTPSEEDLGRRLRRRIEETFVLPRLEAALEEETIHDPERELEAVVRELYERTEQTRGPAAAIERSAVDLPEVFQEFFVRTRRGLIRQLTAYVEKRVSSGEFAPVPDPAAAARFILETVTTFARHRHADPDPQPLDDTTFRDTTVLLVVRSLTERKEPR